MANIASSKKDARRSEVRATRNRALKSAVKTKVTRFRRGLSEGAEEVQDLAARAISGLDRAAAKGVLHKRNAARRKSRLARRLNARQAAGAAVEAPAKGRAASRSSKPGPAKPTAPKSGAEKTAARPAASRRKS